MDKQMKKWFREIDAKENEVYDALMKQIRYLAHLIAKEVDGKRLVRMNRAMKDKMARVRKIIHDWYGENSTMYKRFMRETYKIGWKQAAESLGVAASFSLIPTEELRTLIEGGLVFMKNYTTDMIQIVQKRLALGMLSGESYYEIAEGLEKIIPHNGKRRIKTLVRDQIGRIYQESTKKFYEQHKHLIQEYVWTGPPVEKTTPEVCRDRMAHGPYKYEEFIRMDPHPHINCRRRWIVVPKE